MGTIKRIGRARVFILGGDHLPPHAHVSTPDGEVMVELETMSAMGGKKALLASQTALEWLEENSAAAWAEWRRING